MTDELLKGKKHCVVCDKDNYPLNMTLLIKSKKWICVEHLKETITGEEIHKHEVAYDYMKELVE